MAAYIDSIKARTDKQKSIMLTVDLDGEKRKYEIAEGTYREIGCPLSGYEVDECMLSALEYNDALRRAMRSALRSLAHSDKSLSAIRRKLRSEGFSEDIIDETVEKCTSYGYIDEERTLRRLIKSYAERDLLGPLRIIYKLASRGYNPSIIRRIIDELTASYEIDFHASLDALYLKHSAKTDEEKNKILYKYGYRK